MSPFSSEDTEMEMKMEVEELPAAAKMIGEVTEVMTEVLKEEESVVETEAKEAENTDKIEEEEKERGDGGGGGGEEEEQSGAKKRRGLWESEVRTCVEVDCWEECEGQQHQDL